MRSNPAPQLEDGMSDQTDNENHDAKKDANGHIDKAEEILDRVNSGDVNESEIPGGGTDAEQLERFKEDVEEAFDKIQEDINANRIAAADARLRLLRRKLQRVLQDANKKRDMLKELRDIRRAKRRITAVAIAAAPGTEIPALARMRPAVQRRRRRAAA
jgi:hypothetical protein